MRRVIVLANALEGVPYTSPSNLSTWFQCKRLWAFRYIAGIKSPSKASAELGTDTHGQLENVVIRGNAVDFTRRSGDILQAALHLFPAPRTPGMQGEREFYLQSTRTGYVYMGKKDIEVPPGTPHEPLSFSGVFPQVFDLKTTKDIKAYAKTVDDLLIDPQSTLYALDSISVHGSEAADLAWIYSQTEKKRKAHPVTLRMYREQAERVFDVLENETSEHMRLRERAEGLDARAFALSLPPTVASCKSFGGCPHFETCKPTLTASQRIKSYMSGSLFDKLRNQVNASAPSTPAADSATNAPTPSPEITEAVAPASPMMGMAIEDVPAVTKLPDWATGEDPMNPPEKALPPAPLPEKKSAEDEKASKPKATRTRRTKEQIAADKAKDEAVAKIFANAAADIREDLERRAKSEETGAITREELEAAVKEAKHTGRAYPPGTENVPAERIVKSYDVSASNGARAVDTSGACTLPPRGFTLYVDALVSKGAPAFSTANLIAAAQAKVSELTGKPDFRMIGYGEGQAHLAAAFIELHEAEGSPDIVIHADTAEGRALLEPLSAIAARVVRGIR